MSQTSEAPSEALSWRSIADLVGSHPEAPIALIGAGVNERHDSASDGASDGASEVWLMRQAFVGWNRATRS